MERLFIVHSFTGSKHVCFGLPTMVLIDLFLVFWLHCSPADRSSAGSRMSTFTSSSCLYDHLSECQSMWMSCVQHEGWNAAGLWNLEYSVHHVFHSGFKQVGASIRRGRDIHLEKWQSSAQNLISLAISKTRAVLFEGVKHKLMMQKLNSKNISFSDEEKLDTLDWKQMIKMATFWAGFPSLIWVVNALFGCAWLKLTASSSFYYYHHRHDQFPAKRLLLLRFFLLRPLVRFLIIVVVFSWLHRCYGARCRRWELQVRYCCV